MTPHEVSLLLYNLSLVPVIFFSVLFLVLALVSLSIRKSQREYAGVELPFVTVQIPTYNDPVAERCVRHCLEFDYPKDKYEIVIADDSTHTDTSRKLSAYAQKHPGFVKYLHRNNREGFKAGALKEAMKESRGEVIVIFDSDWMPGKDFLKRAVRPFSDEKVAIVQTRQGFYNRHKNLITRFAAYMLMVYHSVVMPINDKVNTVFFCGTAGAIRRRTFEEVGGWNLNSVTEDSDLTIRVLAKGYRTIYLDFETPSEVPETFEGFVRQQMRWCYGNARVFFDHKAQIMYKSGLSIRQRIMILYVTLGNLAAPLVMLMTVFGLSGWLLGEPSLIQLSDLSTFLWRFLATAGFIAMGFVMLYRRDLLSELPHLVVSAMSIGTIASAGNTVAFFKAAMNSKLHWFCTPKGENDSAA